MAQWQNKEEYEQWKAARVASIEEIQQEQKEEEERLRKLKEEEERQERIWICPECIAQNDISELKCKCGYIADEISLQYLKGNLTVEDLYKTILNELSIDNTERTIFLSKYLLKRFPDTEEARKLSESLNYNPELIDCPTCKSEISINAQSCPKCGEPITDEIRKKVLTKIRLSLISQKENIRAESIKRRSGLDRDNDMVKKKYAGFWIRVVATLLDVIIIGIPTAIILLLFFGPLLEDNLVAQFFGWIIVSGTIVYLWVNWNGRTPGKKLMGIKIVSFPDNEPLTYEKALLRCIIGYTLSGLTIGLGYIMVAFRDDKRGLHDLIAKTCVIYEE